LEAGCNSTTKTSQSSTNLNLPQEKNESSYSGEIPKERIYSLEGYIINAPNRINHKVASTTTQSSTELIETTGITSKGYVIHCFQGISQELVESSGGTMEMESLGTSLEMEKGKIQAKADNSDVMRLKKAAFFLQEAELTREQRLFDTLSNLYQICNENLEDLVKLQQLKNIITSKFEEFDAERKQEEIEAEQKKKEKVSNSPFGICIMR
jgi:hypothetical protein